MSNRTADWSGACSPGFMRISIACLDFPGFENPLEKAVECAEKGAHLYPNNQRTVGILALVHFYRDELLSAIKEVNRALELNPNLFLFWI